MIELRGLTQNCDEDIVAVDHLSLTVGPGEVDGWLGAASNASLFRDPSQFDLPSMVAQSAASATMPRPEEPAVFQRKTLRPP